MRHEGRITGLAAYGNPSEAYNLIKKMNNAKYTRPMYYQSQRVALATTSTPGRTIFWLDSC